MKLQLIFIIALSFILMFLSVFFFGKHLGKKEMELEYLQKSTRSSLYFQNQEDLIRKQTKQQDYFSILKGFTLCKP